LEVRLETPGPDVMGVADDTPDDGELAANFAVLGHE
jgi:hypothetical protein